MKYMKKFKFIKIIVILLVMLQVQVLSNGLVVQEQFPTVFSQEILNI